MDPPRGLRIASPNLSQGTSQVYHLTRRDLFNALSRHQAIKRKTQLTAAMRNKTPCALPCLPRLRSGSRDRALHRRVSVQSRDEKSKTRVLRSPSLPTFGRKVFQIAVSALRSFTLILLERLLCLARPAICYRSIFPRVAYEIFGSLQPRPATPERAHTHSHCHRDTHTHIHLAARLARVKSETKQ